MLDSKSSTVGAAAQACDNAIRKKGLLGWRAAPLPISPARSTQHLPPTTAKRTSKGDISIENVILSYTADSGADFLVMGGYGHSRLREFILGGVTRGILASMTLPVLMSH